jgi:hypothetical protein
MVGCWSTRRQRAGWGGDTGDRVSKEAVGWASEEAAGQARKRHRRSGERQWQWCVCKTWWWEKMGVWAWSKNWKRDLAVFKPTYIHQLTDEYRRAHTIKLDDPYIHRFQLLTNKYKVIFIGFKTGDYNLNIFIGTDEFKNTDKWMSFSYSDVFSTNAFLIVIGVECY